MNEKPTTEGTAFAIPGSVTDLAKGLRELIACIRDVTALIGDGGKAVAGTFPDRRSRGAARNLDTIVFSPAGSRQYLERIANGSGARDDVAGIAAMLEATADEVERSMRELSGYRDTLRESCGMEAAIALDEILYGKFGKDGLRRSLGRIVRSARDGRQYPPMQSRSPTAHLKLSKASIAGLQSCTISLIARLKG